MLGFGLRRIGSTRWKIPALPFYFCMVNFAALIAIANNFGGRHIGSWTPSHEAESGKPSP